MDFAWTAAQIDLRQKLITQIESFPTNPATSFDRETWQAYGRAGILGLTTPTEWGGGGQDILSTIYALEGLGYANADNGLHFAAGAHLWGCLTPILTFGNLEQKARFLPKLASGEWIGALAVSEPEAGSDVASIQTTAEKVAGGYLINGHKRYITNAPHADLILVLAVTNPKARYLGMTAFLVEKETPGLTISADVEKMGLQSATMGDVIFKDCRVPESTQLGKTGGGFPVFSHAMEWERAFILAPAVGAMARLIEQTTAFAKTRQQFGQPIVKFQSIANQLVDMTIHLETARLMLYKTAWLKARGKNILKEAAMTKMLISESWVQVCQDALRIHGAYGYLSQNQVERELRDALGTLYASGSSEMQRQIIAKRIGLS